MTYFDDYFGGLDGYMGHYYGEEEVPLPILEEHRGGRAIRAYRDIDAIRRKREEEEIVLLS